MSVESKNSEVRSKYRPGVAGIVRFQPSHDPNRTHGASHVLRRFLGLTNFPVRANCHLRCWDWLVMCFEPTFTGYGESDKAVVVEVLMTLCQESERKPGSAESFFISEKDSAGVGGPLAYVSTPYAARRAAPRF
jgi:hypothetical protein